MTFADTIARSPVILTEGAVVERLRRDPDVTLDPHILHAGFVLESPEKETLERIYRQYLDIGRSHHLPMMCFTPTWRANPERLRAAGMAQMDLNTKCVQFLRGLRSGYGSYTEKVFIGGLIGCRGDAYKPEEALASKEASVFHKEQVSHLAAAGADFLLAATLPAVSEAVGVAEAMSHCGIPYMLSFVTTPLGTLLDGTPLGEAIETIDRATEQRPLCYLVNCVHPSVFRSGYVQQLKSSPSLKSRLLGLQANTSRKSPHELDGLGSLDGEEPRPFGLAMSGLHREFGLKILGGCCGTDHRHILRLAEDLA